MTALRAVGRAATPVLQLRRYVSRGAGGGIDARSASQGSDGEVAMKMATGGDGGALPGSNAPGAASERAGGAAGGAEDRRTAPAASRGQPGAANAPSPTNRPSRGGGSRNDSAVLRQLLGVSESMRARHAETPAHWDPKHIAAMNVRDVAELAIAVGTTGPWKWAELSGHIAARIRQVDAPRLRALKTGAVASTSTWTLPQGYQCAEALPGRTTDEVEVAAQAFMGLLEQSGGGGAKGEAKMPKKVDDQRRGKPLGLALLPLDKLVVLGHLFCRHADDVFREHIQHALVERWGDASLDEKMSIMASVLLEPVRNSAPTALVVNLCQHILLAPAGHPYNLVHRGIVANHLAGRGFPADRMRASAEVVSRATVRLVVGGGSPWWYKHPTTSSVEVRGALSIYSRIVRDHDFNSPPWRVDPHHARAAAGMTVHELQDKLGRVAASRPKGRTPRAQEAEAGAGAHELKPPQQSELLALLHEVRARLACPARQEFPAETAIKVLSIIAATIKWQRLPCFQQHTKKCPVFEPVLMALADIVTKAAGQCGNQLLIDPLMAGADLISASKDHMVSANRVYVDLCHAIASQIARVINESNDAGLDPPFGRPGQNVYDRLTHALQILAAAQIHSPELCEAFAASLTRMLRGSPSSHVLSYDLSPYVLVRAARIFAGMGTHYGEFFDALADCVAGNVDKFAALDLLPLARAFCIVGIYPERAFRAMWAVLERVQAADLADESGAARGGQYQLVRSSVAVEAAHLALKPCAAFEALPLEAQGTPSPMSADMQTVLESLELECEVEARVPGFASFVDFKLKNWPVIIEYDGPDHYYISPTPVEASETPRGVSHTFRDTGYVVYRGRDRYKMRILGKLGYRCLRVAAWELREITNEDREGGLRATQKYIARYLLPILEDLARAETAAPA